MQAEWSECNVAVDANGDKLGDDEDRTESIEWLVQARMQQQQLVSVSLAVVRVSVCQTGGEAESAVSQDAALCSCLFSGRLNESGIQVAVCMVIVLLCCAVPAFFF